MTPLIKFPTLRRGLNIVFGMLLALMFCVEFIPQAHAQQFVVGTGSVGNSYNRQFTEIAKVCNKELVMVEWKDEKGKTSNGAVKNAEMLIGNEINGAWVQADILHMMARTQDLSDIKTLLVLNNESLHYIVKSDFVVKQGGTLGIGGTAVPIRDLSQIGGMNVVTSGGGAWTAKQVRLETEIQHNIIEVADSKTAVEAVRNGKTADGQRADVALIVGGFPVDMVKNLGPGFRVLNVPEALQTKLAKVYIPARISYPSLADGGAASTMAVQSLLVTREYKSPKMVNALSALRNCVLNNLDDIRETTGNHASWRGVKAENQSQAKWPLYQLPTVAGKK